MRSYGAVHTAFWSSATIRGMPEDARNLAMYLLTSPHTTIAGVMRLPDGYACEDLAWSSERLSKGFAELFQSGFANRCETTKWVWVRKYLNWNQPENPNQFKAAAKVVELIPDECIWKPEFISAFGEFLSLKSRPLPNPSEADSKPFRNQNQNQNQEQGQGQGKKRLSAVPTDPGDTTTDIAVLGQHGKSDDVTVVFDFWREVHGHPTAKLGSPDTKRYKAIKARLKDGYSVEQLKRAIEGIKNSPYHMGRDPKSNTSGTVYDDIELICRDGGKVDKFIRLAGQPSGISQLSAAGRAAAANISAWLDKQPKTEDENEVN